MKKNISLIKKVFISTVIISLFGILCIPQNLDAKNIKATSSKDTFIVFILIGHSNMVGRNNDCDKETHPRAWNYKIDDGTDRWVPAQGPIFYDGQGKKDHGTYIGCGPGMPLLKRLVEEFPDYHFGVIQFAWSGAYAKDFKQWRKHYRKIAPHIKAIRSDVTFGGILGMFGRMERYDREDFVDDVEEMVSDFRQLTDSPNLPYFQQRERPYDSAAKKIRVEQERVAELVPFSYTIKTDGPDLYKGHYSGEAHRLWANEVVDVLIEKNWLPFDQKAK